MIKLNDNSTFIFLWNAFVSVCIVYLRKVSDIGTIIEIACLDHTKREEEIITCQIWMSPRCFAVMGTGNPTYNI